MASQAQNQLDFLISFNRQTDRLTNMISWLGDNIKCKFFENYHKIHYFYFF